MSSLKERLRQVITQLDQELRQHARRNGFPEPALRAHPPADKAAIADYENYLQHPLSASYRAFLELHNGYEVLAFGGDMLAIEDARPGGKFYPEIQKWKKMCADYGSGEVLDGIVVAYESLPNRWVYLDPNRPSQADELTVVQWLGDTTQDHANLVESFTPLIETCGIDVAETSLRKSR